MVVVRVRMREAGSSRVVWMTAISCSPKHWRTISRPLGRNRKVRCVSPDAPVIMHPASDFSGLTNRACALARAAARAATDSLDCCTGGLRPHEIEAHCARF
jgi:hypothetical protein